MLARLIQSQTDPYVHIARERYDRIEHKIRFYWREICHQLIRSDGKMRRNSEKDEEK